MLINLVTPAEALCAPHIYMLVNRQTVKSSFLAGFATQLPALQNLPTGIKSKSNFSL